MPNIMKIRQCFLELQLKMLGMFFLRQSVESLGYILSHSKYWSSNYFWQNDTK